MIYSNLVKIILICTLKRAIKYMNDLEKGGSAKIRRGIDWINDMVLVDMQTSDKIKVLFRTLEIQGASRPSFLAFRALRAHLLFKL